MKRAQCPSVRRRTHFSSSVAFRAAAPVQLRGVISTTPHPSPAAHLHFTFTPSMRPPRHLALFTRLGGFAQNCPPPNSPTPPRLFNPLRRPDLPELYWPHWFYSGSSPFSLPLRYTAPHSFIPSSRKRFRCKVGVACPFRLLHNNRPTLGYQASPLVCPWREPTRTEHNACFRRVRIGVHLPCRLLSSRPPFVRNAPYARKVIPKRCSYPAATSFQRLAPNWRGRGLRSGC